MNAFAKLLSCVLIIDILSVLLSTGVCTPQTDAARGHIGKARGLYEQNRDAEAEKEALRAISIDKSLPEAYRLLSDICLRKGTIQGRSEAEEAVRNAIKYEPENLDNHFALISVYNAQGFPEKAQNYLEKLRDEFPENPKVLYELGKMYQLRALQLQNLSSRVVTEKVYFNKFYREKLAEVEGIYNELSKISPHYEELDRERALLAYMEKDWKRMIVCAHDYVGHNPQDKHAYLILGLAHLRNGEYGEAKTAFDAFAERLDTEEKRFFASFNPFLSEKQQVVIGEFSDARQKDFSNDFWISRDPLYLSDYNERLLEHCGRVGEAYLLFSAPEYDLPGWKTDKGIIWGRYGPPGRIEKNMSATVFEQKENLLTETWYYDGFHFKFFEYPLWSGNTKFWYEPYDPRINNYKQIADALQKVLPDKFDMNIPGEKIDFPRMAVDFRGSNGNSRIELFHAIPVKDIRHVRTDSGYVAGIDNGVFVFDRDWNGMFRKTWRQVRLSESPVDTADRSMLSYQNSFEVPPGEYTLAVEFKDDSSGNIGAIRENIEVEAYEYDSLQVSGLLLAHHIEPKPAAETVNIDGLEFTPNISRRFRGGQPIFLYFEIYNLELTGVPGSSKYRIEYSIQYKKAPEDARWSVGNVLGRVFSFSRNRFELATSAEYDGVNPVENMFIEIDPRDLEPGLYLLTLSVTDLLAKREKTKSAGFYLIEHGEGQ